MSHVLRLFLVVLLASVLPPASAFAQAPPPKVDNEALTAIKANYTKYEYLIPMRDGIKLFTAVYVPKDDSKTYPMLMQRTPYSCRPYGVDQYPEKLQPGPHFSKEGYIFVYQDVRGRWMSEGEYVNMRPHIAVKKGPKEIDESSDTYDTVDFLIKNVRGHNGKVGQWGISYPGFYTVCGMIDAHPAMKAVSPQAPVTDWFVGDDWHHNGALFLPHVFNFMSNFGKPRPEPIKKSPYMPFDHGTPDGYQFFLDIGPIRNAESLYYKGEVAFWNEVMKHGTYDEFWKSKNIRAHIKGIKPAVMTVGGWFDAENLFGALETFKANEKNSPSANNHLVMGPWVHGGWNHQEGDHLGDIWFNAKTSEYYKQKIELPFFEFHLKGKGGLPGTGGYVSVTPLPKAWVFETGTNIWRKFDAWPPKGAEPKNLYLGAGGSLLIKAPDEAGKVADEFVSDPAKPVPYINNTAIGMTKEYMTGDQRLAGRRPDVLVYQTPPLTQDLTVGGTLEVELFVSTTGTDADWIVKLIDVYPSDHPDPNPNPMQVKMGGYQTLVRGDVMRGKFHNSLEKPEPFEPGKVTPVKFTMQDTLHTFRPGHRVMIQVQSTWFPLVDRNPQKFCDIYTASEGDFSKQTHRVYHSQEYPSRVRVNVIK